MSFLFSVEHDFLSASTLARFWSQVIRCNHEYRCIYCCWPWDGVIITTPHGLKYGQFTFRLNIGASVRLPAHRHSWFMHNHNPCMPTLTKSLVIRHMCNISLCVNPLHLTIGTQRDNIHDAIKSGRFAIGDKNGKTKISDEDVKMIRILLKNGCRPDVIATKYKVASSTIYHIKIGRARKRCY